MTTQLILQLLIGGLLGITGQGLRMIVGWKKYHDATLLERALVREWPDRGRLLTGLIIGFCSGIVMIVLFPWFSSGAPDGRMIRLGMVAIIAVGYAFTDLMESLIGPAFQGSSSKASPGQAIPTRNIQDARSGTRSAGIPLSGLEIARLAIEQQKDRLYRTHKEIYQLIPAIHVEGDYSVPCIDIAISGHSHEEIPLFLDYTLPDGSTGKIKTRVITRFGNARPHVGRGDMLSSELSREYIGTVGCVLRGAEPPSLYLLTCNHVLTGGNFEDPGALGSRVLEKLFGKFDSVGVWQFGKMDAKVDVALVAVDQAEQISPNDIAAGIYPVGEADCGKTEVELLGASSLTQPAFIIHINQPISMDYDNKTVDLSGLITISGNLNPFNFSPVTQKGDSGALVYHAANRQPIGIVLGANERLTYVMPMKSVFDAFPEQRLAFATI